MPWPNDSDGDVFRRLEERAFNFSISHSIDFNVDFEVWPPPKEALAWLKQKYGRIGVHEPEDTFGGYVEFQVEAKLTYDLVVSTQEEVSAAMAKHDGICETWGVMQKP